MATTGSSHRSEKRGHSDRTAIIKLGLFKTAKCKVEDLSASGAKLVLLDDVKLPDTFSITLNSTGRKRMHKCANRWQNGKTVGVEFLSSRLG